VEKIVSKNQSQNRIGIFILFLICGLAIFLINITYANLFPLSIIMALKAGLIILFLSAVLLTYRIKKFSRYRPVLYAFFTASLAVFLGLYFGKVGLKILNLSFESPAGFAVMKFTEDLLIVISIIVLVKLFKSDFASIYISKGNLRTGLLIGLSSFIVLSLLSVLQPAVQQMGYEKFLSLIPWILIIILADGFMEELLFRGLFLKRFRPFLGARLSNVLTAIIFTLTHVQVTFAANLPVFLLIVFFLGLVWGYIMQKTDNIWGSFLFHAGAGALIIIDAFTGYGVTT